jgi:3-oxoacyl-[acyl-carrier-protein] synthase II
MSEGGAILVLEELEHAKRRGVPIIAEVVGYGLTNDAYHITSPDPNGDGAFMAMKQAIESAEITPTDIDYINAHGTSTVAGDRIEALSIKRLFDYKEADYRRTAISSTKSMTGHMLGGAGAFEALVCVKACQNDKIPPTINLDEPDDEMADLDLVPNVAKQKEVCYAMSNSFGFGGHNAVLVFRKYGSD